MASSYYNAPETQPESDIADQNPHLHTDRDDDEYQLPPRPTSRLGFNHPPVDAAPPFESLATTSQPAAASVRSRATTLKWTKSLFQKMGIASLASSPPDFDMDITAVSGTNSPYPEDEDVEPLSLPQLPSLVSAAVASTSSLDANEVVEDDQDACGDDYDSDSDDFSCSEDDESDVEFESYAPSDRELLLFPPIPSARPPSPPPTSQIPFPTITHKSQPFPPPVSPSPPAARVKYGCPPSPLSPTFRDRTCETLNPLRHLYGHHGRSRHALLHVKYLWGLRADEWEEHTKRQRESYAYCGIAPAARMPPRYPPPRRTPSPDLVPIPPMTVHPRRGDLSALRDPYCAHMDRCFVGMPLWTIEKTLWMYDVHMLAEGRARATKIAQSVEEAEDDEDSEGESLATSRSTAGFSDDSDETLVESDQSDDGTLEEVDLDGKKHDHEKSYTPSPPPNPSPIYLSSKRQGKVPLPHWETSWYKRWEILIELVRLDTERERAQQQQLAESQQSSSPPSLAVRTPRFFIGDDEDENECDESWNEDRWDELLGRPGAGQSDLEGLMPLYIFLAISGFLIPAFHDLFHLFPVESPKPVDAPPPTVTRTFSPLTRTTLVQDGPSPLMVTCFVLAFIVLSISVTVGIRIRSPQRSQENKSGRLRRNDGSAPPPPPAPPDSPVEEKNEEDEDDEGEGGDCDDEVPDGAGAHHDQESDADGLQVAQTPDPEDPPPLQPVSSKTMTRNDCLAFLATFLYPWNPQPLDAPQLVTAPPPPASPPTRQDAGLKLRACITEATRKRLQKKEGPGDAALHPELLPKSQHILQTVVTRAAMARAPENDERDDNEEEHLQMILKLVSKSAASRAARLAKEEEKIRVERIEEVQRRLCRLCVEFKEGECDWGL
ncbi:hypothetical protein FB45DRAFT_865375 [Roridomyces roridus]|uniref:Uncharacterized protein n=1 Tax=Roridomyces roridus TaxID=1738132 RepID=A0AAD7BZ12_9AGAR|nr:hypothetical protein FB45DRAFT_865375 [Roridomyces roridus]